MGNPLRFRLKFNLVQVCPVGLMSKIGKKAFTAPVPSVRFFWIEGTKKGVKRCLCPKITDRGNVWVSVVSSEALSEHREKVNFEAKGEMSAGTGPEGRARSRVECERSGIRLEGR